MIGQTLRSVTGAAWVVCGLRPGRPQHGPERVDLLTEDDLHSGHGELTFSLSGRAFQEFCARERIMPDPLR